MLIHFSRIKYFLLILILLVGCNGKSVEKRYCERYTKEMNGGVHSFRGVDYFIKLCGVSGKSSSGSETIEISVYSVPQMKLLEKSFFIVNWNFPMVKELEYAEGKIVYFDADGKSTMEFDENFIEIPPAWWRILIVNGLESIR